MIVVASVATVAAVLVFAIPGGEEDLPAHKAGPKASLDRPQAAVEHFVRSVAANDFDAVMEGFVLDDLASGYDFAGHARHMKALAPIQMYAPPKYEMYVRLNQVQATGELAHATKLFAYGFLVDKGLDLAPVMGDSDADIEAFIREVDPARLRALKVVRIDPPAGSDTARARAVTKEQAAHKGADDLVELIALFELGGHHYWAGFRVYRYGKSWRIGELRSYFADLTRDGFVEKTTPEAYQARLN